MSEDDFDKCNGTITDGDGEVLEVVEWKRDGDDLLVKTKDGRFIRYTNVRVVPGSERLSGPGVTDGPMMLELGPWVE